MSEPADQRLEEILDSKDVAGELLLLAEWDTEDLQEVLAIFDNEIASRFNREMENVD